MRDFLKHVQTEVTDDKLVTTYESVNDGKFVHVFFRIEAGYKWGEGMPADKTQAFFEEISGILEAAGWQVKMGDRISGVPTAHKGLENLYCHPMDVSGWILETSVKGVEKAMQAGTTFTLRTVDIVGEGYHYTPEEFKAKLQELKPAFEADLLARFQTPRRNLVKRLSGMTVLDLGRKLERDAKAVHASGSSSNAKGNEGLAQQFVTQTMEDLVAQGKMTKHGNDMYRTVTANDAKRAAKRPLPPMESVEVIEEEKTAKFELKYRDIATGKTASGMDTLSGGSFATREEAEAKAKKKGYTNYWISELDEKVNEEEGDTGGEKDGFLAKTSGSPQRVWADKNGVPLKKGDIVSVKYTSGKYGQTGKVTGALVGIDTYGGIRVSTPKGIEYHAMRYDYRSNPKYNIFSDSFNDYEHGHETWVEKIKDGDPASTEYKPKGEEFGTVIGDYKKLKPGMHVWSKSDISPYGTVLEVSPESVKIKWWHGYTTGQDMPVAKHKEFLDNLLVLDPKNPRDLEELKHSVFFKDNVKESRVNEAGSSELYNLVHVYVPDWKASLNVSTDDPSAGGQEVQRIMSETLPQNWDITVHESQNQEMYESQKMKESQKVVQLTAFINACLDSTSAEELYDFVQNNAEKALEDIQSSGLSEKVNEGEDLKKGDKVKLCYTGKKYEKDGPMGIGVITGRDRSGYAHYKVNFTIDGEVEEYLLASDEVEKVNEMRSGDTDYTDRVGPLHSAKWGMYSYERPAYAFWNGFANGLKKMGYKDEQIKIVLQSKIVRWMLDSNDNQIEDLGRKMGQEVGADKKDLESLFAEAKRNIKHVMGEAKKLQEGDEALTSHTREQVKELIDAAVEEALSAVLAKEGVTTGDIEPMESLRYDEYIDGLADVFIGMVTGNRPAMERVDKLMEKYGLNEMGMGRHNTTKSPKDPTYSKEWSGVSYAPHAGKKCGKCGSHTHKEAGELYCPNCDDYVRASEKKHIPLSKVLEMAGVIDDATMEKFVDLASALSPENLSCDGEISQAQCRQRYKQLMQQWKALEQKVGKQVSEEEVWNWELSKKR